MTTSLELPDPLYQRAVKAAAQRQLTLTGLVALALQRELGSEIPAKSRRMEKPPVTATGPVPAMTNEEIARLFEEEEIPKIVR